MRWSLQDVAAAVDGTRSGDGSIDVVVVDSREARPGALFVALRGERVDGHDFLREAVEGGASAVLCERGRLPVGVPGVEVEDTLVALRMLAERRRTELTVPVVAITGSSGKTTTKDFTAAVLGPGTHAAPRSFNNEVGVPLTVLGCPDDATTLVVEVGSRGAGHIADLAAAIRPDVAVITNIGRAHLETFGTVEGVLAAKWELVEALGEAGTAVLPTGDPRLTDRRSGPMLTFGEGEGADVRVVDIGMDDRGIASFTIEHGDASVPVTLDVPGRHQPGNAAAAVAVAVALERDFTEAVSRLATVDVSPWRMELEAIPVEGGSVTVVNDSYNANPDSMAAALDTVVAMPGRHIAVLGKMHELGEAEADSHREVGARASELGFSVITVGEDPGIAAGAGNGTLAFDDPDAAVGYLRGAIRPGDVVLVKASRAAGLEAVARGLREVGA